MNRKEMIKGYEIAKKTYEENIGRLNQMLKIVESLKNSENLSKEIRKAILQGQTCLKRFDNLLKELDTKEAVHAKSLSKALMTDTDVFGKMSASINSQIQAISRSIR